MNNLKKQGFHLTTDKETRLLTLALLPPKDLVTIDSYKIGPKC